MSEETDEIFQRNWHSFKGTESSEITPPTAHSNFTVESKTQLHNKKHRGDAVV